MSTDSIPAVNTDPSFRARIDLPSDTELVITRTFHASAELVWEAMTVPEHVRQWWGPRRFEMTVCEIDLRVGGTWRYVQRDADGTEFGFSGEYLQIEAPHLLRSTEEFEPMPGTGYEVTTTFTQDGDETTVRSHIRYRLREHRDGHVLSGMEPGMNETFDRLDEYLEARA